ncbi:MAG: hypothetical protein N2484_17200 [Clostridia bacterium]|nr:hypothetical protein [Clostridia bacterium]
MKELIKPLGGQSFLLGMGLAAAAYFLGPTLKEMMKPAAVKGTQGIMALGERTRQMMSESKEKMSDMMADKSGAAAGSMTESLYEKLLQEIKEEREQSNRMVEEIRSTLGSLKDEIANMKNGGASPQI